jgi:hypothetical protein
VIFGALSPAPPFADLGTRLVRRATDAVVWLRGAMKILEELTETASLEGRTSMKRTIVLAAATLLPLAFASLANADSERRRSACGRSSACGRASIPWMAVMRSAPSPAQSIGAARSL